MFPDNPYLVGFVLDQYEDKSNKLGFKISYLPANIANKENVKLAAINEPEYALVITTPNGPRYVYRIDNPLDTFTSAWYFTKTAHVLPEHVQNEVAAKIVNSAYMFAQELPDYMKPLIKKAEQAPMELPSTPVVYNPAFEQRKQVKKAFDKQAQATKLAAKLTQSQRESLPDSAFGLVIKDKSGQKIRKYPMHDENHVRAAITFFNMHHDRVPPKYRSELARKIKQKASEYGIEISEDNALNKYAAEKLPEDFYKQIALRQKYVAPEFAQAYEKIAEVAHKHSPEAVAKVIEKLDKDSGFDRLYPAKGSLLEPKQKQEQPKQEKLSDKFQEDILQLMQM